MATSARYVNRIEEIGSHKAEHPKIQNERYKSSKTRKTESGANMIPRSEGLFDSHPPPKIIRQSNKIGGRRKSRRHKKTRKGKRTKSKKSKKIRKGKSKKNKE